MVECYLPIKRKELLIRAATWTDLDNTILRKNLDTKRLHIMDSIFINFPEKTSLYIEKAD